MLEKKYLVSGAIGLLLFFQLQVLSTVYGVLVQTGVMNGFVDTHYFLKGSLSLIPSVFDVVFCLGLGQVLVAGKANISHERAKGFLFAFF